MTCGKIGLRASMARCGQGCYCRDEDDRPEPVRGNSIGIVKLGRRRQQPARLAARRKFFGQQQLLRESLSRDARIVRLIGFESSRADRLPADSTQSYAVFAHCRCSSGSVNRGVYLPTARSGRRQFGLPALWIPSHDFPMHAICARLVFAALLVGMAAIAGCESAPSAVPT